SYAVGAVTQYLVFLSLREPAAPLVRLQRRPDFLLEKLQHARAALAGRHAFEAAPPLVERAVDRFGLGLAREPGHFGGQALHGGVLDVQRHDYTMVYQSRCKGVLPTPPEQRIRSLLRSLRPPRSPRFLPNVAAQIARNGAADSVSQQQESGRKGRQQPERRADLAPASRHGVEQRVQQESPEDPLRDRQRQRDQHDGDEGGQRVLDRREVDR